MTVVGSMPKVLLAGGFSERLLESIVVLCGVSLCTSQRTSFGDHGNLPACSEGRVG